MRSATRLWLAAWSIVWLLTSEAFAGNEIHADFLMDSDPVLSAPPPLTTISKKCLPLWLAAMKGTEADLQRRAAASIAEAHRMGVDGMTEAEPALRTIVAVEASSSETRFAAARALIVLEARESAQVLFEASKTSGADLRLLIEPALAQWKFEPIREIWRARLTDKQTGHRNLILAVRGAGELEDGVAAPGLLSIVHDSLRPATVRLAAARSIGKIRRSGLESTVDRLMNSPTASVTERLCAVALLEYHDSDAARGALTRLAKDVEPGVAAPALARLNAIDPHLVAPLAETVVRNSDADVRMQGVEALAALPSLERIVVLSPLFDDPHPRVRRRVCEVFFKFAKKNPDLDEPVRVAGTAALEGEGWRRQEQAALLLAALDHKPAAERLVQLLESPRAEVMAAAAWGLRKLALPATLPAMLDKAKRQSEARVRSGNPPGLDKQVAHLWEAFGIMKYAPAEPLMRQYIAKNFTMGDLSRPAAIWALGHLHAGTTNESLAELLLDRLTEPASDKMPEKELVRAMSAVSLARMHATATVPAMRNYLELVGSHSPLPSAIAIRWAVRELSGEVLPEALPLVMLRTGWFLEPLESSESSLP